MRTSRPSLRLVLEDGVEEQLDVLLVHPIERRARRHRGHVVAHPAAAAPCGLAGRRSKERRRLGTAVLFLFLFRLLVLLDGGGVRRLVLAAALLPPFEEDFRLGCFVVVSAGFCGGGASGPDRRRHSSSRSTGRRIGFCDKIKEINL